MILANVARLSKGGQSEAERQYYDKQEEKEEEKESAKADAEKATGVRAYEKWQRDPLSSIVWAGTLILELELKPA